MQALFTVIGNSTMAYAAYRIFKYNTSTSGVDNEMARTSTSKPLSDTNLQFATKLAVVSFLGAILVKYGELYLDFPFDATTMSALSVIGLSTALATANLTYRSISESSTTPPPPNVRQTLL